MLDGKNPKNSYDGYDKPRKCQNGCKKPLKNLFENCYFVSYGFSGLVESNTNDMDQTDFHRSVRIRVIRVLCPDFSFNR